MNKNKHEKQSQTGCFLSQAEVTKSVPSPARANASGLISFLETDCCERFPVKKVKIPKAINDILGRADNGIRISIIFM